jgi:hypothetical protein
VKLRFMRSYDETDSQGWSRINYISQSKYPTTIASSQNLFSYILSNRFLSTAFLWSASLRLRHMTTSPSLARLAKYILRPATPAPSIAVIPCAYHSVTHVHCIYPSTPQDLLPSFYKSSSRPQLLSSFEFNEFSAWAERTISFKLGHSVPATSKCRIFFISLPSKMALVTRGTPPPSAVFPSPSILVVLLTIESRFLYELRPAPPIPLSVLHKSPLRPT